MFAVNLLAEAAEVLMLVCDSVPRTTGKLPTSSMELQKQNA